MVEECCMSKGSPHARAWGSKPAIVAAAAVAAPDAHKLEQGHAALAPAPPPGPRAERRRRGPRRRHNRHLRDALTARQRLSLACFTLAWVALTAAAWSWWLQPRNSGSPAAFAVNTGVLAIDALGLPIWFFFWIWRMRRPDPALEVPELRTAMVVTKAPSEPWPVVRETLEAMLSQDFPYLYDVWLADEAPAPETVSWCGAHGVRISTR
jgi:hypothetical protein